MAERRIVKNIDGVTHIVAKRSKKQRVTKLLRKYSVILIVALVGLVIAVGMLAFVRHKQSQKLDTVTGLTLTVGKHVQLPKGEQPIIATVTDKSSLRTPFLKEADNGDRILIYEKARRVIIYRPSIDRIVDIGPVELSNIPKTTQ